MVNWNKKEAINTFGPIFMIKDHYLLHKQRNKLQLHSLSTCSSAICARINCSPPPTCLRRDCCFRGSKRLFLGNFAKAPRCVFFSSVYTVATSVTLLNGPMKHFAWILHVICNWQSCRRGESTKKEEECGWPLSSSSVSLIDKIVFR